MRVLAWPPGRVEMYFQPGGRGVRVDTHTYAGYDPSDYRRLLEPLENGQADVVYGSRFVGAGPHRVLYFWDARKDAVRAFCNV